jgi:hypothetical protein
VARPPRRIDPEQVRKIAQLGCTQEEIGDILGCSPKTLRRRFRAELTRGRAEGRISLRRAQYKRALKDRSDRMLIWLGRVELGQSAPRDSGVLHELLAELLSEKEGDRDELAD